MELGVSLYPDYMDWDKLCAYVREAAELGCRRVFLSLILEELNFAGAARPDSKIFDRTINLCHEFGMQVTADVNDRMMDALGTPKAAIAMLAQRGLDVLRADSALSGETLDALASTGMGLELNAADLAVSSAPGRGRAEEEVARLLAHLPAGRVQGCFNFYPRTGTGLSLERVRNTSDFLHQHGIQVAAFVASLTAAPVLHPHGRGVCTAECLRDVPPEVAAAALKCCGVDAVLFGDSPASHAELKALADACADEVISLPVVYCRDCPESVRRHIAGMVLSNREDTPEDVIRCTSTRGLVVEPFRTGPRDCFSVTVDNSRSAQYKGELQIMLRDMPACEVANVVGFIHPDARILLPLLGSRSFRLVS